jgi:dihydropteroate synthase
MTLDPSGEAAGAPGDESAGAREFCTAKLATETAEGRFRIMGVLNVTPDSFSDGGLYLDPAAAVAHGLELASDGAAILDVGGESTRPGAEPVPTEEELRRVVPVIEGLAAAGTEAQISVDTSKASVAAAALAAGATLVNDVTALRGDPGMASLVAGSGCDCCLMHMLGEPRTMQRDPRYGDVVAEVKAFLAERMAYAISVGVAKERILLDPGIGFGKTAEHNLELLARLGELVELGRPIVVGTSRKSFLGRLVARARTTDERLAGTIATNVLAYERGASVFRVHDVRPVHDALTVAAATVRAGCLNSMTPTSSTTSTKA